jgi:hypothetical protein
LDIRFNELASSRWNERLTSPTGSTKARPGCGASRVLLVKGWGIQQRNIAGTAGQVTIGRDAHLEIALRGIHEAAACRRSRDGNVLAVRQTERQQH